MLVIMMNWGEGMNPEGFVDGMDGFGHLCAGIGVENPLIQIPNYGVAPLHSNY